MPGRGAVENRPPNGWGDDVEPGPPKKRLAGGAEQKSAATTSAPGKENMPPPGGEEPPSIFSTVDPIRTQSSSSSSSSSSSAGGMSPALESFEDTFSSVSLYKQSPLPAVADGQHVIETIANHVGRGGDEACVIVLMGVSGSGKTTTTRSLRHYDERFVHAGRKSDVQICELLHSGKHVVFDSTNTTVKARSRPLSLALRTENPTAVIGLLIDTANELSKTRLASRNETRGVAAAAIQQADEDYKECAYDDGEGEDDEEYMEDEDEGDYEYDMEDDEKMHWEDADASERIRLSQMKRFEAVVDEELRKFSIVLVLSMCGGQAVVAEAVNNSVIVPTGTAYGRGVLAMRLCVDNPRIHTSSLPTCDEVIYINDESITDDIDKVVHESLGFHAAILPPMAAQLLAKFLSARPGAVTVNGERIIAQDIKKQIIENYGKGHFGRVLETLSNSIVNHYPFNGSACSWHSDAVSDTIEQARLLIKIPKSDSFTVLDVKSEKSAQTFRILHETTEGSGLVLWGLKDGVWSQSHQVPGGRPSVTSVIDINIPPNLSSKEKQDFLASVVRDIIEAIVKDSEAITSECEGDQKMVCERVEDEWSKPVLSHLSSSSYSNESRKKGGIALHRLGLEISRKIVDAQSEGWRKYWDSKTESLKSYYAVEAGAAGGTELHLQGLEISRKIVDAQSEGWRKYWDSKTESLKNYYAVEAGTELHLQGLEISRKIVDAQSEGWRKYWDAKRGVLKSFFALSDDDCSKGGTMAAERGIEISRILVAERVKDWEELVSPRGDPEGKLKSYYAVIGGREQGDRGIAEVDAAREEQGDDDLEMYISKHNGVSKSKPHVDSANAGVAKRKKATVVLITIPH